MWVIAAFRIMTGYAGQWLFVARIIDSRTERMGKLLMAWMALSADGIAVSDQHAGLHAAMRRVAFAAGHLRMIEQSGFMAFFNIFVTTGAQTIFFTLEILRVVGCMGVVT